MQLIRQVVPYNNQSRFEVIMNPEKQPRPFAFYGLIARPVRNWLGPLNVYRERHRAWTASLYVVIMLVLWVDFEIM
jgi:hypothetical protein